MNSDRLACPFPANEDGAQYVLRGRYIMPAPNAQGAKRASKKALMWIGIVSCVVVIAVCLAAFWLGRSDRFELPLQKTLADLIGRPVEEIVEQLGLEEYQITEVTDGMYSVAGGCTYAGVAFDIQLYFEEHEKLLSGFAYQARYDCTSKEAAADFARITDTLDSFVYGVHTHDKGLCLKQDKTAITDKLEAGKSVQILRTWDLTPKEGHFETAASKYLKHLENSEYWEGNVDGYIIVPAAYYGDLDMKYDPQTNTASVCVQYVVEPRRSGLLDF